MKRFSKPLRAVAFSLLAGLLLFCLSEILWEKNGVSMPFYAEPKQSLDVIFLGSSRSNTALSPTEMFEENGFAGYVMYNWSQTPWAVYYYARNACRTQTPRVLAVEANVFLYGTHSEEDTRETNEVSNVNALKIPFGTDRLALALAMNRCQTDHPSLGSLSALAQFHTRWKGLTKDDFTYFLSGPSLSGGKGGSPLYLVEAFSAPQHTAPQPDSSLFPACRTYLDRLLQLGREKDIALVFVVYPDCSYTEADYARLAWLAQYCGQNGARAVDFTGAQPMQPGVPDYATDMADYAHVNYLGAEKITRQLGELLQTGYALPDHRADAAYAGWHAAAQQNRYDCRKQEIKISATPQALLQHAAGDDFITFLYAVGDMTAADPGTLPETFAALGMDAAVFGEKNAAALWVWENGTGTAMDAFDRDTGTVQLHASPGCVTVDGVEQSYARPGLNAVVLNRRTGEWVQTITWSTEHAYASYTR